MGKIINLYGRRYGRLTVVGLNPVRTKHRLSRWDCVCDCGESLTIIGSSLTNGLTKSCGCLQRELLSEKNISHGLSRHRLYYVWSGMVDRCTNPKNRRYKDYGGRGIYVCDRWLKIENFVSDIEDLYREGKTLDRKNNDDGYHPENVKMSTPKEQANNRRNTPKGRH